MWDLSYVREANKFVFEQTLSANGNSNTFNYNEKKQTIKALSI